MSAKARRAARQAAERKLKLNLKAYPPNEQIFRDYIEAGGLTALSPEWVFWMLSVLHYANEHKIRITEQSMKELPMHLRGEPPMALSLPSPPNRPN